MANTFTWSKTNGFLFVGCSKEQVRNPHTLDELKEYVTEVFIESDDDQDVCGAVCHSVLESFQEWSNVEGGISERLRDWTVLKHCKLLNIFT